MLSTAYIGVLLIGLLHGLEPGHGWPVAVVYSVRKKRPLLSAALSSSIIGAAHLISSIAVVVAYVLLSTYFDLDAPWLKYVAAGLLLILSVKLWLEKTGGMEDQHGHIHADTLDTEHEHEHEHDRLGVHTHLHTHKTAVAMSLWGLASFAFILGFAHEEEFALLGLTAGGANAWVLMLVYGISVLAGLIAVTIACVRLFNYFHMRLLKYEKYVPKVGAVILAIMAIAIIIG